MKIGTLSKMIVNAFYLRKAPNIRHVTNFKSGQHDAAVELLSKPEPHTIHV